MGQYELNLLVFEMRKRLIGLMDKRNQLLTKSEITDGMDKALLHLNQQIFKIESLLNNIY